MTIRRTDVRISPDPKRRSGRLLEFGTLRQSYVDLEDPGYLHFSYVQAVAVGLDTTDAPQQPVRALHLGAGGLTIPRYLAHTRPGSSSLVAEISPDVIEVTKTELGFAHSDPMDYGISFAIGDAREITASQPSASYEVVVGDAFGEGAVPIHLVTLEFMSQVRRVLVSGGVYILNLIDAPPMEFFRATLAAVAAVFPHVAVTAQRGILAGREQGNLVVYASDTPLARETLSRRLAQCSPPLRLIDEPSGVSDLIGDADILTDEMAAAHPELNHRT